MSVKITCDVEEKSIVRKGAHVTIRLISKEENKRDKKKEEKRGGGGEE